MSDADTPIVLTRSLPLSREAAFDLFVERIGEWWPRDYTFSRDPAADLSIEPFPGGAYSEQVPGGARLVWGTVLSIEPPLFLRLAWQISPDRQLIADPSAASRVTVEFRAMADGTLVELAHRDFLRHGEAGEGYRAAMASPQGWPFCLDALAEAAARKPSPR
jgi:uncharacterized protein YndB with AHSA1/START domain